MAKRGFGIGGIRAGLVEEQLVEEERVAGLEDRPCDPLVAGRLLGLRLRYLVVEHRVVGGGGHDLVEPARNDVQARRLVAAARQREPQVERAHVAHEGAVLVPGPRDVRLRLAQGRLLERDQRPLAEVGADQLGQPRAGEHLQHLEREHRRIRSEQPAALLDPEPGALRDLERRHGSKLLVEALGGRLRRRGSARARRTLGRSGPRTATRSLAVDEAAHQQAAVAQDARAEELRREVLRSDLRQDLGGGKAFEVRLGMLGLGAVLDQHAQAGDVTKMHESALRLAVAVRPVRLGQPLDLGKELVRASWKVVRDLGRPIDHGPLHDRRVAPALLASLE